MSLEIQSKMTDEHLNRLKDLPMVASNFAEFMDMNGKTPSSFGVPKVIYSSRTHSQLAQAMQELKRTSYNTMKAAIIGSREQLCIHPDVMKETNNATKVRIPLQSTGVTDIQPIPLVTDSHVQIKINNSDLFVLSQSRIDKR